MGEGVEIGTRQANRDLKVFLEILKSSLKLGMGSGGVGLRQRPSHKLYFRAFG